MDDYYWSIRIPLLKNRIIRNQLVLALGIPFGILCVVLLALKAYEGLVMVGGTLVLGFLLVMLIFRGTYDVQFMLDDKGITCETQSKQKKRVHSMARAATVMGVLSGYPTTAAAGMMAGARTKERLLWKQIKKVKYLNRQSTIMLNAGFGGTIAVFCTEENYSKVSDYIHKKSGI